MVAPTPPPTSGPSSGRPAPSSLAQSSGGAPRTHAPARTSSHRSDLDEALRALRAQARRTREYREAAASSASARIDALEGELDHNAANAATPAPQASVSQTSGRPVVKTVDWPPVPPMPASHTAKGTSRVKTLEDLERELALLSEQANARRAFRDSQIEGREDSGEAPRVTSPTKVPAPPAAASSRAPSARAPSSTSTAPTTASSTALNSDAVRASVPVDQPRKGTHTRRRSEIADVCLIIEGAYPYTRGGVSMWTHDLIKAHPKLRFEIVALVADDKQRKHRYDLADNVVGLHNIVLQPWIDSTEVDDDAAAWALMSALHEPLQRFLEGGSARDLKRMLDVLREHAPNVTWARLLNSEASFALLQRMFERQVPHASFLRYFWSWRSMVSALFAVLLAPLPRARVYHALSTGYAGLTMARASMESNRPGLVTEHGIYTLERRIELALSSWLMPSTPPTLSLDDQPIELRDVWMQAFGAYSRAAYESASKIITLYEGNQGMQERDGAPFERMRVIPNGVDVEKFGTIVREPRTRASPTVALIARVVPIKDVKSFIRAAAILRDLVPNVHIYIVGTRNEDPTYARECQTMAIHLGLAHCLTFKGHMSTEKVLPHIDVLALTSLSEAQPLVLLEAGAAGVPVVSTDVGACAEIIEGRHFEHPALGSGGFLTPLTDAQSTAEAIAALLRDPALRQRCGQALAARVKRYYNKRYVDLAYRDVYRELFATAALRGTHHMFADSEPDTTAWSGGEASNDDNEDGLDDETWPDDESRASARVNARTQP